MGLARRWICYGEADDNMVILLPFACLPRREVVHGTHMRRHLLERLFLLNIESVAFFSIEFPVVCHFYPRRLACLMLWSAGGSTVVAREAK